MSRDLLPVNPHSSQPAGRRGRRLLRPMSCPFYWTPQEEEGRHYLVRLLCRHPIINETHPRPAWEHYSGIMTQQDLYKLERLVIGIYEDNNATMSELISLLQAIFAPWGPRGVMPKLLIDLISHRDMGTLRKERHGEIGLCCKVRF